MNRHARRASAKQTRRRQKWVKAHASPERAVASRRRTADMWADLLDGDRQSALALLTHTFGFDAVPDALAWVEAHCTQRGAK